MSTIGCLFCTKAGSPSAVNQHLREYLETVESGRNSKSLKYHNIDIILAFVNSTKTIAKLEASDNSADRIIVLKEFATHITKHLSSDREFSAWGHRNLASRTSKWWETRITRIHTAYLTMGRAPEYLTEAVRNAVDRSIQESLKDDEDDSENDMDMPGVQRTINAGGRSQIGAPTVLAVSSGRNANAPAANVELTMQNAAPQIGERNRMQTGPLGNNNNRAIRGDSGEGPSNRRPINTGAAARRIDANNSDDDDETNSTFGNGKIIVGKRRQQPSARAFSAQIPLSRVPASRPGRAASYGDDTSSSGRTAPRHLAPMAPFLRLDVYGLDNKLNQIPISYGTTLAQAIKKALAFAPAVIRDHHVPVRFQGMEKSEWEGELTESKWDQAMEKAGFQPLQIVLRLVLIPDE